MKLTRFVSTAAAVGLLIGAAPVALADPVGGNPPGAGGGRFSVVQPAADPTSFPTTPVPPPAPSDAVDVSKDAEIRAAFANGGYVRLVKSFSLESPLELAAGKSVTLDLNGMTLTGKKESYKWDWGLINRGTLTVRSTADRQTGAFESKGIQNYGHVKMESGTLRAKFNEDGAAVFNMVEESRLTMTGGSLNSFAGMTYGGAWGDRDGSLYGIPLTQAAGQADITGGYVVGDTWAVDARGGTVNISNAYVRGDGLGDGAIRVGRHDVKAVVNVKDSWVGSRGGSFNAEVRRNGTLNLTNVQLHSAGSKRDHFTCTSILVREGGEANLSGIRQEAEGTGFRVLETGGTINIDVPEPSAEQLTAFYQDGEQRYKVGEAELWSKTRLLRNDAGDKGTIKFRPKQTEPVENRPPTVKIAPTTLSVVPGETFEARVTTTDPDGNLTKAAVMDKQPDWVRFADGKISGTVPDALSAQELVVRITATDDADATGSAEFRIKVVANQVPSISAQDVSVKRGSQVRIPVTATDPEGHKVTLSLVDPPAGFTLNKDNEIVATAPGGVENVKVRVKATDVYGASAEHVVAITITNPYNQMPIVSVKPARVEAFQGADVTLEVKSSDEDGQVVGAPKLVASPQWLSIEGSRIVGRVPADEAAGTRTFSVQVTDNENGKGTTTVSVVVKENHAPEITAKGISVEAGKAYSIPVTVRDVDGHGYRLELSNAPAGVTLTNGQIKGTAPTQAGDVKIVLVATDDLGKSSTKTVVVTATQPSVQTPQPTTPTVEPTTPTVEPSVPTVEPSVPTVEPSVPTVEPTTPTVEPTTPTPQPTTPTPQPTTPTVEVIRLAGESRYGTSRAVFGAGDWGKVVVLASGANPADALAATPLAAALNAPVLLTPSNALDPQTRAALHAAKDGGATEVIIVGGTASVSGFVEGQARALGFTVKRYAGNDRVATAIELSDQTRAVYQANNKKVEAVFFVDGTQFADALAAGPAAAAKNGVILLTQGDKLPRSSEAKAKSFNVNVFALGGKAAQATSRMGAITVVGADRVQTATMVAQRFVPNATVAVVANGDGFADALSGGALAARNGGALLLTKPNTLPQGLSAHIRAGKYNRVFVTGGAKSVSPGVLDLIRRQIER